MRQALVTVAVLMGVAASQPGCQAGGATAGTDAPPRAYHGNVRAQIRPLEEPGVMRHTHLAAGRHASAALIQTRGAIAPHYHARHDETVLVWEGKGTMRLGDEQIAVEEGSVVFIPEGTVHSFTPVDDRGAAVVSIFSPAFDGEDRVFIDE